MQSSQELNLPEITIVLSKSNYNLPSEMKIDSIEGSLDYFLITETEPWHTGVSHTHIYDRDCKLVTTLARIRRSDCYSSVPVMVDKKLIFCPYPDTSYAALVDITTNTVIVNLPQMSYEPQRLLHGLPDVSEQDAIWLNHGQATFVLAASEPTWTHCGLTKLIPNAQVNAAEVKSPEMKLSLTAANSSDKEAKIPNDKMVRVEINFELPDCYEAPDIKHYFRYSETRLIVLLKHKSTNTYHLHLAEIKTDNSAIQLLMTEQDPLHVFAKNSYCKLYVSPHRTKFIVEESRAAQSEFHFFENFGRDAWVNVILDAAFKNYLNQLNFGIWYLNDTQFVMKSKNNASALVYHFGQKKIELVEEFPMKPGYQLQESGFAIGYRKKDRTVTVHATKMTHAHPNDFFNTVNDVILQSENKPKNPLPPVIVPLIKDYVGKIYFPHFSIFSLSRPTAANSGNGDKYVAAPGMAAGT